MIRTILIYTLSYLTVFGLIFSVYGNVVFNFTLMYSILAYCLCSIQFTDILDKPLSLEEDYEDHTKLIVEPELNHPNLKIRQHYRNIKNDQYILGHYLIIILFPIFVFIFFLKKFKVFNHILDFFISNKVIELYYNNKKVIIEQNKITENGKEYDHSLFCDGREEYRYKGKLHRENGAAITYSDEYFFLLKNLQQSKFYINGKKVEMHELNKELNRNKVENF